MTADDAWTRFDAAGAEAAAQRILDQFEADPDRLARMSVDAAGLHIDLSKQSWSRAAFDACLDLARAMDVEAQRARLFGGEAVNATEGRAVLHMALRGGPDADYKAQGAPVSAEVAHTRAAMRAYATHVRAGAVVGATGQAIRAVVHIGIGGSDLGPRLVWEALKPLNPAIDVRFVANIDPGDLAEALIGLDPATTLVVVVSKTFTTQETLANARAAHAWLSAGLTGHDLSAHLVGVTAAPERARAFGCGATFGFRDWVGGRYSLWSAVGLSCAIGLGPEAFEGLLGGARAMDDHFRSAPLERNAPVLMALAQVFNVDGLGRRARSVAPYAHRLRRLAAFLQQLEMESNGKRRKTDGTPVTRGTCPVVFGEPGTNGQHAFFQQLHQGPEIVPTDFIVVRRGGDGDLAPLWSNALAQAEALMRGRTEDEARDQMVEAGLDPAEAAWLAPHKSFPGDRPSTLILMDRLTPQTLGALIALHEHKVFVEGVVWGINSFDQWGVELGKAMAGVILHEVEGGESTPHDPSTAALIRRLDGD